MYNHDIPKMLTKEEKPWIIPQSDGVNEDTFLWRERDQRLTGQQFQAAWQRPGQRVSEESWRVSIQDAARRMQIKEGNKKRRLICSRETHWHITLCNILIQMSSKCLNNIYIKSKQIKVFVGIILVPTGVPEVHFESLSVCGCRMTVILPKQDTYHPCEECWWWRDQTQPLATVPPYFHPVMQHLGNPSAAFYKGSVMAKY